MCGIFGLVDLHGDVTPARTALVERGTQLLAHRGPDGHAVLGVGRVCFGHRRLSIVDVEGGSQPMWSTDRRGVIAYNGEVYNFESIEQEMRARGRTFATRSDTEGVLNAYLTWGADEAVARLRGMFAFAAIDFERQEVLLARDRLGKKPMFYTVKDGALIWSSELEPLYQTAGPFDADPEALDQYLAWQYIPSPRTIYRGVRSLPPGHLATVDLNTGEIRERRYWDLTFTEDRSLSLDEWGERLDAAIREAVRIRFMSDVPFGAFLSGGIDSSLVVAYMAELMEQPVKTFTIGFNEADFSETEYARQVAQLNRTEHHIEIVDADSMGLLPLLARHYGQPFADSSAIPTYYLSRMAARHVKMALSGDGGDENFAGYHSYAYVEDELRKAGRTRQGAGARDWFRSLAGMFYRNVRRRLADRQLVDEAYALHCVTARHFSPDERRQLLLPHLHASICEHDAKRRSYLDVDGAPIVSRLQHLDLKAYLPYDILAKVDIAAMANSLEVRVPLLDHHVVELAATIPSEHKLKPLDDGSFDKKHLLKRLAKQRYPAALIDRPKMGFGVPIGAWMATKLRPEVEARLLASPVLPRFFEMRSVETVWQRHVAHQDQTPKVWNLLFLEEWMRGHQAALGGLQP
jgi:asparagine synthase (glutamine-hydrolysing)